MRNRGQVILFELEHPIGLADAALRDVALRLGQGEEVTIDISSTHRQMQGLRYIFPVTYI